MPILNIPNPVEWRVVSGFSKYAVSADGRVKRIVAADRGISANRVGFERKISTDRRGYKLLNICDDNGKVWTVKVHILVCSAFHGPKPSPEHEVAHNDGDPSHNHYLNLRWDTAKGNAADRVKHGRQVLCAKLKVHQVLAIKEELNSPDRLSDSAISRFYGVTPTHISTIRRGIRWQTVGPEVSAHPRRTYCIWGHAILGVNNQMGRCRICRKAHCEMNRRMAVKK